MVAILLADGFEDMEVIITADLLMRGKQEVLLVSTQETSDLVVKSARNIEVKAHCFLKDLKNSVLPDCVVIPGGMGGTKNLACNNEVVDFIDTMNFENRLVAAICAAPVVVLSKTKVLNGKKFTCYPKMEEELCLYGGDGVEKRVEGAQHYAETVIVDDNLITSQGPGTTAAFALTILEKLAGKEIACSVAKGALFNY
ncbi:MAG: hypothetical protein E7062_08435 [Spirochaetaceae bacterium]|nr:hypothetical protein [Spirochaetaceae bacterium]